jgi:TFIIF-interacting CTD phosphatase-like protein
MKTWDKNKKTLVLDLDETLVYSYYTKDNPNGHSDYSFVCNDGTKISVIYRPHLTNFIKYAKSNFNIIVWTSATKDYAQQVIDHLFGKGTPLITGNDHNKGYFLRHFHLDDFTNMPKQLNLMIKATTYWKKVDLNSLVDKRLDVKPLRKIVKQYDVDIRDIIAIDNDPYKFYNSYGNYWFIPDFNGDNLKDDYLLKFIDLLDQLKVLDDVRVNKDSYKKMIK